MAKKTLFIFLGIAGAALAVGAIGGSVCYLNRDSCPLISKSGNSGSQSQSQLYQQALDQGLQASQTGQKAATYQDWQKTLDLWRQSLQKLRSVPSSDPNYAAAQQKLQEYAVNQQFAAEQVEKEKAKAPPEVDRLKERIAKNFKYRPRVIDWGCNEQSCPQAFTVPDRAWNKLSATERTLLINYAKDKGCEAVVIGRVIDPNSINLDRQVWNRQQKT